MEPRIVEKEAFIVAGVAVETSMADQAADAAPLAARFMAPGFGASLRGRLDPAVTYALHSGWGEAEQTYRLMLAHAVEAADQPPDVVVLAVPRTVHSVFRAHGSQPAASIAAWAEITRWRDRPDLTRTGPISFEIHDARQPYVDIHIPAVLA